MVRCNGMARVIPSRSHYGGLWSKLLEAMQWVGEGKTEPVPLDWRGELAP